MKIEKFSKTKNSMYIIALDNGNKIKIHEDLILKYELLLTKIIDNKELINITQVKENESYGKWAYATVSFGNNIVRDAFVTPLAYEAYTNGDIFDLMLVVLESSKRYLAAVFKADPKVHLLAMSPKSCIYADKDIINIEAPTNGPGIFWHFKNE